MVSVGRRRDTGGASRWRPLVDVEPVVRLYVAVRRGRAGAAAAVQHPGGADRGVRRQRPAVEDLQPPPVSRWVAGGVGGGGGGGEWGVAMSVGGGWMVWGGGWWWGEGVRVGYGGGGEAGSWREVVVLVWDWRVLQCSS